MGCRFRFSCPACEYSAEVSGGPDAGFSNSTTTIVCENCNTLRDIEAASLDSNGHWKEKPFRCPRSAKHRIREWKDGDPCPQCGGKMENEGGTVLWD